MSTNLDQTRINQDADLNFLSLNHLAHTIQKQNLILICLHYLFLGLFFTFLYLTLFQNFNKTYFVSVVSHTYPMTL